MNRANVEIWMELDQDLESELEDFELGLFALHKGFKTALYQSLLSLLEWVENHI